MISELSWEKLKDLAEEVSQREGCRLYDMEFSSRRGQRILRIYIESLENHVSIDQCADVSKGMSLLLDVEDLIPGGQYELEVSSPGVERPLRLPWHFQKVIGEKIKLKAKSELQPQNRKLKSSEIVKTLTGLLKEVSNDKILLQTAEDLWEVSYEHIHRAHLVFEFEGTKKMTKRGNHGGG